MAFLTVWILKVYVFMTSSFHAELFHLLQSLASMRMFLYNKVYNNYIYSDSYLQQFVSASMCYDI